MTHITDDMIQRGKEELQVKPKDVDAIRAHAARLLDRMGKTPHGPKRKLLASQHVDLINEALRAEGWNAALLSSPLPTASGVEVKPAEIEDLIEQLLDAQQNINLAANENMDQSLCDASALIDKTEEILHRILSTLSLPAQEPLPTVEVTEEMVERACREYTDLIDRKLAPAAMKCIITAALSQNKATHRHKKRGTEYVLIGIGKMQSEKWYPVDMREVAIYRSATDPTEIWVRPREEFEDGRFEALSQNDAEDLRAFRASKRPRR
jgi:hypothetical protein